MNAQSDVKYILLIDDSERDVALFEKAANRNCRAEVRRAATGEDGIHMLLRRDVIPSLIVLEIDLPSGDGYALLRFVREDPELRSIPVVVLTGIFSLENLDPAWGLGASAVILKPDSPSELNDLVQSLCDVWLRFAVAPRPLALEQL
jgi:CheY-like chemotaxis protein